MSGQVLPISCGFRSLCRAVLRAACRERLWDPRSCRCASAQQCGEGQPCRTLPLVPDCVAPTLCGRENGLLHQRLQQLEVFQAGAGSLSPSTWPASPPTHAHRRRNPTALASNAPSPSSKLRSGGAVAARRNTGGRECVPKLVRVSLAPGPWLQGDVHSPGVSGISHHTGQLRCGFRLPGQMKTKVK